MEIRLNFIVEGQTERTFVKQILKPHLADISIWASARCVETKRSRNRKFSGGIQKYSLVKKDIQNWMKEDQNPNVRFTTMLDLYALPADFPGYKIAKRVTDPYQRARTLEDALEEDIADNRLIPYIQLHEFEALLLADPLKLGTEFLNSETGIRELVSLTSQYESPELIDDGSNSAPSKRIIAEIPEYEGRKQSAGPNVADKIGLSTLRSKCTHFDGWVRTLELLSANYAE